MLKLPTMRPTTRDRKRDRRAHRRAASYLINGGTLFNAKAPPGSTPFAVAQYHLNKARNG